MGSRDIVVVGAGVIGCAVAYELARRGASVRVVDDRPPGMGATQASAGVLAPFIEAREDGPLLDLTVRALELFDAFVADVVATSGVPVAYCRSGTLDVALRNETVADFRTAAGVLTARGVDATFIGSDEAARVEPYLSDSILGGLMISSHGFVNAMELTCAMSVAAGRHGTAFVDPRRVTGIRTSGAGLVVETSGGPLTADGVVLAAGSWAGQVTVAGVSTRLPVRPVRGQLLQLAWRGPTLRRVTWGERCYLVPWANGTLLVGATVEDAGFDERTTAGGVQQLLAAACEIVPHAETAGFLGARVGLRPGTPDDLPVIGPSQSVPNLMYATGHYRNGVLLSPLTARLVADALLDRRLDPLLEVTSPARFGEL